MWSLSPPLVLANIGDRFSFFDVKRHCHYEFLPSYRPLVFFFSSSFVLYKSIGDLLLVMQYKTLRGEESFF